MKWLKDENGNKCSVEFFGGEEVAPVKAIVDQLANVETELAKAKAKRAEAIVSIEQRRKGPMSGVIGFVGDYK